MSLKEKHFIAEAYAGGNFVVLKESDVDVAVAELKKKLLDEVADKSLMNWPMFTYPQIEIIIDEVFGK